MNKVCYVNSYANVFPAEEDAMTSSSGERSEPSPKPSEVLVEPPEGPYTSRGIAFSV